ncbi:hypothetical protein QBC35DRAFT_380504 [Podospora australis]|uniref:Xylanolytic transcriptional activator regulatory domain-containing protein n=1 Tax=Podospora australis TaxID=1536484 RepID=A0AAN7AJV5_9PEZI|nr:hypothetical protein QBC35DRAFT_380504 [Podospora australis]
MNISDLLVRHEKLVHLNEGNSKDGGPRPRKPSTAGAVVSPVDNKVDPQILGMSQAPQQPHFAPEPMQPTAVSSIAPDSRLSARAAVCNLDLLSDAATHLASGGEVNSLQTTAMPGIPHQPPEMTPMKPYQETMAYGDRGREPDGIGMPAGYTTQHQPPNYDEYNIFLDDWAGPHLLPPGMEGDQGFGSWSRLGYDIGRGPSKPASAFPSRFPSLQPDGREAPDGPARSQEDAPRASNWRISAADHTVMKNRLDEFSSVLPNDFVFPSRYTLTRFVEGYISGLHDQLPFLHLPTLMPAEMSPELLLAILAVGAQYRFETNRGHALWYAAKAVALEQIRRRSSHEVHGLLPTPAAYSPHSTRPSPSSGFRHSFPSVHQDRPMTRDTHREPYSPNTPQSRLETIQALLLLFAVGLWGAKAILDEAMALQSLLAMLIRQEGLIGEPNQHTVDWEAWVRQETANRTKLMGYCFFNLCSIAYNIPPLLTTMDMNLFLPSPSRLWRAETSWQWQEARQGIEHVEITLPEAFMRLFNRAHQGPPPPYTSLGYYVLVHALLQQMYFMRQTWFAGSSLYEARRALKEQEFNELGHALNVCRLALEASGGSAGQGVDDFSAGPIDYISLVGLAFIRSLPDLGPIRNLETRDHILIASSLFDAPLLARTVQTNYVVMQVTMTLSQVVKQGVSYVAKAKSQEWSMQHSLYNLECAVVLSKWLLTLAAIGPGGLPPTTEENRLLNMIRRMLDETEFAVPVDPSLAGGGSASNHHGGGQDLSANGSAGLRQLACGVVRLWAETFKGAHIFEVVQILAAGLESYGDLIEKPRDRTPLRGIGGITSG